MLIGDNNVGELNVADVGGGDFDAIDVADYNKNGSDSTDDGGVEYVTKPLTIIRCGADDALAQGTDVTMCIHGLFDEWQCSVEELAELGNDIDERIWHVNAEETGAHRRDQRGHIHGNLGSLHDVSNPSESFPIVTHDCAISLALRL